MKGLRIILYNNNQSGLTVDSEAGSGLVAAEVAHGAALVEAG